MSGLTGEQTWFSASLHATRPLSRALCLQISYRPGTPMFAWTSTSSKDLGPVLISLALIYPCQTRLFRGSLTLATARMRQDFCWVVSLWRMILLLPHPPRPRSRLPVLDIVTTSFANKSCVQSEYVRFDWLGQPSVTRGR